jgi:hypothetical protein
MSGVRTPAYPRCAMIPLDRLPKAAVVRRNTNLPRRLILGSCQPAFGTGETALLLGNPGLKKITPGTGFIAT